MNQEISAKAVAELRARTGAGLMDCKQALKDTNGNAEEAITLLRKKGVITAAKKAGREASEGIIDTYIHMGRIGVMIELNCETDFVAKNDEFKQLAHDIALHIAASSPLYIDRGNVPQEAIQKEQEIIEAQCQDKPPAALEKIIEGRLEKFYQKVCLLDQTFIKNPDRCVRDILIEQIAKMGENIVVGRFVRYQIGE